jgi:hypothetical protein
MLENIERTWSRHCYGQGHCVTPLSNIAVLATNVIKMTEWPAYKMARDLANGKVFPVSETVIMQTACNGIGPDGEAVAGGLKQSAPLDFVLERFALDLGALQHGVGMAECIGKRGAGRDPHSQRGARSPPGQVPVRSNRARQSTGGSRATRRGAWR